MNKERTSAEIAADNIRDYIVNVSRAFNSFKESLRTLITAATKDIIKKENEE